MPDLLGDLSYTWPFYAGLIAAYLLGSIPFGFIVTRLAGLGDIRQFGSGNIGATNVLRTGRKDLAALTLLLDGGKGALAILLAMRFGPDMAIFCAGGVIIGHIFSIWLKLRGGKGVATTFGVLIALAWPIGLVACAIWVAVAALTRYSSLAAAISIVAVPGLTKAFDYPQISNFTIALAMLILLRHIGNLRRLFRGEEPKIGQKAAD